MKSKLFMTISAIALSASIVIGGTYAAFSDYGTSNNNIFTAGTLDLTVDGTENHDVKFDVTNMKPDSQPTGTFTLKNKGSIDGFLNISHISFQNLENNLTAPEVLAGDTTSVAGELGSVVNVRLYVDSNGDGYFSTGETMFYNGLVDNLPTEFKLNTPLASNTDVKINAVFDWWDTARDNLAQDDSMKLNFTFDLTQRAK